jgi:hypothetical protein
MSQACAEILGKPAGKNVNADNRFETNSCCIDRWIQGVWKVEVRCKHTSGVIVESNQKRPTERRNVGALDFP